MAEYKVTINATPSKVKVISVSPKSVQNTITASPDTSLYYSNLSKKWATEMDGMVLNEDYSSKYYANISAENAQISQTNAQACEDARVLLQGEFNQYSEELEEIATENSAELNTVAGKVQADTTAIVNKGKSELNAALNTLENNIEQSIKEIEGATLLDTKVDIDDMVIMDYVEAPFVSYNNITNCILEVPHRINIELKDGVLTLKKGSKVIVPNGAGKFDEVIVPQDVVFHSGTIGTDTVNIMLCCNLTGGFGFRSIPDYFVSGATAPSNTSQVWYDTTNNAVKKYENGSWVRAYSLPIGIYVRTEGVATSIDQVFNGQGYIGATRWVDKGVKGLIPYGKNDDGSLNNIEYITSKVELTTRILADRQNYYFVGSSFSNISDKQYYISQTDRKAPTGTFVFNTTDNFIYDSGGNKIKCFYLGSGNTDATRITSFETQQPFRAVDYNDIYTKNDVYTKTEADNRYVNNTGDTMSGNLTIAGSQKTYAIKSTDLDYTTKPSTANISALRNIDKNNKILGDVRFERTTDGIQWTRVLARNCMTGSEVSANIGVAVGVDGKGYTYAPTPATTDNSTKIATTAYVRTLLTNTTIGIPNYSAGVTVAYTTLTAGYTAPSKGILMMMFYPESRKEQTMSVNGVQLPYIVDGPQSDADNTNITIILNKGDVYKFGLNDTTTPRDFGAKFYPFKGV